MKRTALLFALLPLLSCSPDLTETRDLVLRYDSPALQWKESLPIGNGRLGTMVAGNPDSDTLVINEETLWSGGPHDYVNPEAKLYLKEVQELISRGNYAEALEVADAHMIGVPRNQQHYQLLGKLIISTGHTEVSDYRRYLDLNRALVSVQYEHEHNSYKREIFASHPDDLIVLRYTTTNKEGMELKLKHVSDHTSNINLEGNRLMMEGRGSEGLGIPGAIRFSSCLEVVSGEVEAGNEKGVIRISGDREIILHYTAATNYKNYRDLSAQPGEICAQILDRTKNMSYQELFKRHAEDYSTLFHQVECQLGSHEANEETMDRMLERYRTGESLPHLEELFFQINRYLTIASSRPGSQPMNLQGIWNDSPNPPWGCKWTLNINVEMNYWMTEAANLSECHEPLFDMIRDLHETGGKMAREHYGCRGFMVHHNTDLWRGAAPVDGANWGLWPLGGAWLTRHLWEHFLYTQDMDFLREYYPIMKDASLFFFDHLVEGYEGYMVTNPAISFEQSYKLPDGRIERLCEGPTMDNQILRDLFENCHRAATLLDDDQSYRDSLTLLASRLRPTEINSENGQLMEWAWPAEPSRVSGQLAPLWAVNPGHGIHPLETPELAEAAKKTILYRNKHLPSYETGGSWVSGTRANFWARLQEGDQAYAVLRNTLDSITWSNLLVSFYPKRYFMIDGNLGPAAAMVEMLVQSQRTDADGTIIIDLLPALPKAWPEGSIKGIRARGGFELDLSWKDGELKSLTLSSEKGNACMLNYRGTLRRQKIEAGDAIEITSKDFKD